MLHSLPVRPSNFTNSVTVPYTARYTTFSYMHKTRGHFDSSHFQSIIKSQATTRCTNMSGGLAAYILPERATGHLSLVLHSTYSVNHIKSDHIPCYSSHCHQLDNCYTHSQATNTQLQYQNVSSLAVDCSSCCSCCSASERPIHGMASGGVAMTCATCAHP